MVLAQPPLAQEGCQREDEAEGARECEPAVHAHDVRRIAQQRHRVGQDAGQQHGQQDALRSRSVNDLESRYVLVGGNALMRDPGAPKAAAAPAACSRRRSARTTRGPTGAPVKDTYEAAATTCSGQTRSRLLTYTRLLVRGRRFVVVVVRIVPRGTGRVPLQRRQHPFELHRQSRQAGAKENQDVLRRPTSGLEGGEYAGLAWGTSPALGEEDMAWVKMDSDRHGFLLKGAVSRLYGENKASGSERSKFGTCLSVF
ncbi:hypothetical protein B0H14DRAFT_2578274 [Mycena olivaceomarginata]|nr:hypothetical protein B0H14DRAFT_2578274 [Mycena olivaceomarginata]